MAPHSPISRAPAGVRGEDSGRGPRAQADIGAGARAEQPLSDELFSPNRIPSAKRLIFPEGPTVPAAVPEGAELRAERQPAQPIGGSPCAAGKDHVTFVSCSSDENPKPNTVLALLSAHCPNFCDVLVKVILGVIVLFIITCGRADGRAET